MVERVEALVEPSLLVWARESAGLTADVAAQKARITQERLESWERGEQRPTIKQLQCLAGIYKRPLAVFYLPEPPTDFQPLHDFRRLSDALGAQETSELRTEIRRASYRREVALELAEDWEDTPPPFEVSASLSERPEDVGARIRDLLGISVEEQANWEDQWAALANWRSALESVGVLVFQASGIAIDEMRGFSIADRPFPVIVVNNKDTPRARIFSLMHELTHILLHDGGLCDLYDEASRSPREQRSEQRTELFCNSVAAAILVPKDDFLAQVLAIESPDRGMWFAELHDLSSRYKVSREVILRRLLTLGKVDQGFYWHTIEQLHREYEKLASRSSSGGPTVPVKTVSKAGQLFSRLVLDSYHNERITAGDLSEYLEVRLKHLPGIEHEVRRRAQAERLPY